MKNIFSTEGLADWLETQEPDATYDYMSHEGCILARYFHAMGLPVLRVAGDYWRDEADEKHSLPGGLSDIAVGHPRTYKAALERARLAS